LTNTLELVTTVLEEPACHPRLIGNSNVSLRELEYLKSQWVRREALMAARHPVVLSERHSDAAEKTALGLTERSAKELLRLEGATTWEDLSRRESYHTDRRSEIETSQKAYRRLCEQIGLVCSPLLTVRRAQLQAVLSLASLGTAISRGWWKSDTTPVLTVAGWKAQIQGCAIHTKNSPSPLHFFASRW
jgi:hypothetical protein